MAVRLIGYSFRCTDATIFPGAAEQRVLETTILEGRPGADHFPMAGQGLRMNVNGRLTAPPLVEDVLVTNSVDGMVSEGGNVQPKARGTTLAHWSVGSCSRTRILRGTLRVGRRAGGRAGFSAEGLRKIRSSLRNSSSVRSTGGSRKELAHCVRACGVIFACSACTHSA